MKKILALDPGPSETGFILWNDNGDNKLENIIKFGDVDNLEILQLMDSEKPELVLIEDYEARNTLFGRDAYKTISFIRKASELGGRLASIVVLIKNSLIRTHHNGRSNSTDADTINSLLDKYSYLTKCRKKVLPKGVVKLSSHAYQAFALLAYWLETEGQKNEIIHPKNPKFRNSA